MMGARRRPTLLPWVVAVVLVAPGLIAAAPQQQGTVSSGDVVIGVRVLTPDGRPMAGLEPADIEVLLAGRLVPVTAIRPQATAASAADGQPARRLIVVVNRPSMAAGAGRAALEQFASFLERLPASEYAAVWLLPVVRPQLLLTGDRSITRAALAAATGTRPASPGGRFTLAPSDAARIAAGDALRLDAVAERECPQGGGSRDDVARCREELRRDALQAAEQARADGQQVARELQQLVGALRHVAGLKHVVVLTAGGGFGDQAAVRTIAADAAAARVTIHAIQLAQLAGARGGTRSAESSLEGALATATGGIAFTGSDAQVGLVGLERELAAEYALAIAPDAVLRNGQAHDIEVKVRKAGLGTLLAPRHIRLDPLPEGPAVVAATPPAPVAEPAAPPAEPAAMASPPPPSSAPAVPAEPTPVAPAGPPAPADAAPLASIPLQTFLSRAADYVRRFERTMSTAVLEERYVQLVKRWALPPKSADLKRLAWLPGDGSPDRIDVHVHQRRQTRADLLLVQLPNQRWMAYRDVLELNGREQRGREDRLRDLFVQQTDDSHRQLHRINQASADLNLGPFYREINLPTVVLMILQASHEPRFTFAAGGTDRVGGAACRLVTFVETARPTIVRTREERDVPLKGSACVDAGGVVWRTRLELDGRFTVRGVVEVTYGPEERVDVLVPKTMWEWFGPLQKAAPPQDVPIFIETLATYSNLRRFSVSTSEDVK